MERELLARSQQAWLQRLAPQVPPLQVLQVQVQVLQVQVPQVSLRPRTLREPRGPQLLRGSQGSPGDPDRRANCRW